MDTIEMTIASVIDDFYGVFIRINDRIINIYGDYRGIHISIEGDARDEA